VNSTHVSTAITGKTRVVGVIGDPVRHSMSPVIQNAAFQALGLNYVYVAFPVSAGNGGSAVDAMRTFDVDGLSVTMPHKEDVARAADEVSDDVLALGAANTLTNRGGRIRADVTDGVGCVNSLRANGFEPEGRRCMVIGAGGAGRAVVLALRRAGAAEIVVVNRGDERAALAQTLAGSVGRRGTIDEVGDMNLVVNATPIGMGTDGRLPLDPVRLHADVVVNDLIYHPLQTPLLKAAAKAGATAIGGLGMLIHQAACQISLWTSAVAPIDVMQRAAEAELERQARETVAK
jgi:shikimate dehydrogenase